MVASDKSSDRECYSRRAVIRIGLFLATIGVLLGGLFAEHVLNLADTSVGHIVWTFGPLFAGIGTVFSVAMSGPLWRERIMQIGGALLVIGDIAGAMVAHFVLDIPSPSTEFFLCMVGPACTGIGILLGIGLTERRTE